MAGDAVSAYGKPAGPRPILVGGFALGLGLFAWGVFAPSVHSLWQVPAGLGLMITTMGKMASR